VQPICTTAINAFRLLVLYLKPVMPTLSDKVQHFLQVDRLDYESLNHTLTRSPNRGIHAFDHTD
jgi:methionyl-tRNA synthetase